MEKSMILNDKTKTFFSFFHLKENIEILSHLHKGHSTVTIINQSFSKLEIIHSIKLEKLKTTKRPTQQHFFYSKSRKYISLAYIANHKL